MSIASDTVESIGWHKHGRSWVWGILAHDGCDMCDLADRWLAQQKDWREMIAEQIRERRAIYSEPVGPPPKQFVDPHQPLPIPSTEEPSLDKIKKGPVMHVVVVEPKQEEMSLSSTTAIDIRPDNEVLDDEPPPPPPPKAPEPFKLSNPDAYSLTKGGRRRRK